MTDPFDGGMDERAEKSLWHEIRNLRADLVLLRSDLQIRLIEAARQIAQIEQVSRDVARVERALEAATTHLQERIVTVTEDLSNAVKERVTIERYRPTEWILYGLITLITAGFVGALIALVWKVNK